MGKEKLDWCIYTNDRLGYEWCNIKVQSYKCPICGGKLFSVYNTMSRVMDGNTVIHCDHGEHTFYSSAWDTDTILYQDDNATETSFKYDKKYHLMDGVWLEM